MRLRPVIVSILAAAIMACGTEATLEAGSMDDVPLPVEMVVIGDFGAGTEAQYAVASQVEKHAVERDISLLVTTGDNFYSDDVTAIWEEPYGWLRAREIDVAASWGNHDVETERRAELVDEELDPPARWYSASLGSGKLIVLDSTQPDDSAQTAWLESELDSTEEPIVVVFHHPEYTCGVHSTEGKATPWGRLLEDHAVNLVLNGHEHNYQRFMIEDTTYVVTGGGGAVLTELGTCPSGTPEPVASDDTNHHFLLMEVKEASIEAEVVAADGTVIDTFRIDY